MPTSDELLAILNNIVNDQHTPADLEVLRQALTGNSAQNVVQIGKYTVNIGQGQDIRIGDQITYQGTDAETIRGVFCSVLQEMQISGQQPATSPPMSPEAQKDVVCQFLENIEDNFKYIRLFHTQQPITLKDQYIPIQVTLEPHKRDVETLRGYWESEEELKRVYALKGGEEKAEEELKRQQVDWQEAKCQHQRIMVLADPGMGKSTLLRMEAGAIAQQERQQLEGDKALEDVIFPLFLRLSELAKRSEEVIDAIPELIQRDYPNTAPPLILLLKEKLKTGKCLLLLDALDEVPKVDRNRIELKEKLNRFVGNYSCQIICTSRIVGYDGAFVDGAKEVEIVPFSDKHIKQYIEIWFTNAAEHLSGKSVSAAELVRELRSKPQVRGLAQNPLLLSLICSLYQEKGLTLPARRCQVYEKAVEYMLGKWSQNRRDQSEGRIRAKLRLLEDIAYYYSCEGQEAFEFDDLYDRIEEYLQGERVPTVFRDVDTDELITELSEQDGILQKLYAESDEYLFLHRTFQEYLTACYLERLKNGIELVKEHFWDYGWHETISLMAGLMKKPISLLQAITSENDDIFQTLLLLAGCCVVECNETSHPLIEEIIDRIFEFWMAYPDAEFIQSVVVAVGQTHLRMTKKLQDALRYKGYIRRQAAEVLVQLGGVEIVLSVIAAALEDGNWYLRRKVTAVSELIDSVATIPALIAALKDGDWRVRMETAKELGRIGNVQAIPDLIAVLKDDESAPVRGQAAMALGQIGSVEAVPALVVTARWDKNYNVWSDAEFALKQIVGEEVLPALYSAISYEIQGWAPETLGRTRSIKPVRPLTNALQREDRNVQKKAAGPAGQMGHVEAVPTLIARLKSENRHVRRTAAESLGRIGDAAAVPALIDALKDENTYVRSKAVAALGQIGDVTAMPALIPVLKDQDWNVRWQAIKALEQIDSTKAVSIFTDALTDEDMYVRKSLAEALGRIGGDRAVSALIPLLKDEDRDVRWQAAEALEQIGSTKAVSIFTDALKNEYSNVRRRSAEALGRIGGNRAVPALTDAFKDEDSLVRRDIVKALEQIGSDEAVSALIAALEDEDMYVRSQAVTALGQIGRADTLAKLLQSHDTDIHRPDIFLLARKLSVRFSKEGSPIYPAQNSGKLLSEQRSSTNDGHS